MKTIKTDYNTLPSYVLVDVILACKKLIPLRPSYKNRLNNTIVLVKGILIKRQLIN